MSGTIHTGLVSFLRRLTQVFACFLRLCLGYPQIGPGKGFAVVPW
jgi:hypothetical protein